MNAEKRKLFDAILKKYDVRADGTIWTAHAARGGLRELGTYYGPNGYRLIRPSLKGRIQTVKAHALICYAFNGPAPPGKPFALHRNGDRRDNRAANLYWGDHRDNGRDTRQHGTAYKKGRGRGARHPPGYIGEHATAQRLEISPQTLQQHRKAGRIPGVILNPLGFYSYPADCEIAYTAQGTRIKATLLAKQRAHADSQQPQRRRQRRLHTEQLDLFRPR